MALAVLTLAQSAATQPPPAPPDPVCSPGPSSCFAWHTSNVTVTWSPPPAGVAASGCGPTTISSDTAGAPVSCTWSNAEGSRTTTVLVRRDATPPAVSASADRGPDSNGWYNRSVGIRFTGSDGTSGVASCSRTTYGGPDTEGTTVGGSCTDRAGNTGGGFVSLKYDATAPTTSGATERGPDANGWYNRPIAVRFSGTDALSGIAACPSVTYGGPDSGEASVAGGCTDKAGNTGKASAKVRYDATAPVVEVKPARKPDMNGWYNRPVLVAFVGKDALSGVDACSPPVRYRAAKRRQASVSGTCRDRAANTSRPAALVLRYDATPPRLGRVRSEISAQGVTLRWSGSGDSRLYVVIRRPGTAGSRPSRVYRGRDRAFTDRRVRNGVVYRYTVTAYDEAGNGAAKVVVVQPRSVTGSPVTPVTPRKAPPAPTRASLRSPADGARVSEPPLLRWSPARGATYYNVQLYRDGKKVLTTWQSRPDFRVPRSWRFEGRRFVLEPGRYRWYVWPGYGRPAEGRYGKLIGTRWFVITR
jgi:hypothetical protein